MRGHMQCDGQRARGTRGVDKVEHAGRKLRLNIVAHATNNQPSPTGLRRYARKVRGLHVHHVAGKLPRGLLFHMRVGQ